jgi:glycosyltransferase involved in cell wall biosynthesis
MRATAASFLHGGVSVVVSPKWRHHGSHRRFTPVVVARNAHRNLAAAADDAPSSLASAKPTRSVLFVSFLWPEASSSAAGVRTHSLLNAFREWGWHVHFLACAKPNEHTSDLERSGVVVHAVLPNRGEEFEAVLETSNPDAVVFDRFTAEEAFSFRVKLIKPNAARILDMQDLHSLRYARQAAVKETLAGVENFKEKNNSNNASVLRASLAAIPFAGDSYLARELASVHRSDLTLVCSPVELKLMRERFKIDERKLALASFFCESFSEKSRSTENGFSNRAGFTTIGTFYHPPNVDSVKWLKRDVWPLIRTKLPDAEMRVYGAYPTEAIKQLHNPHDGFLVLGFAESVESAMSESRVLLAPLRFGAGIKGKIVDAWMHGLPVVTTPIGAEGMVPGVDALWEERGEDGDEDEWGGRWQSLDAASIARDAVALHEDEEAWEKARANGSTLINTLFPKEQNLEQLRRVTEGLFEELESENENTLEHRRRSDFTGATLWHHSLRSTEYFSRWIEVKETGGESGMGAEDRE